MAGRREIPLIASVRNCEVDRGWTSRMIDRMVFRNSAAVLANSRAVRDFLIEKYDLEADRIRVVHNGLDLSRFRPRSDRNRCKQGLGFPADCVLVGGMGRLERQKRFDRFIDFAVSLRQEFPRLCFLVVGEGGLKESLEARIRRSGLEDSFRVLPPREDVEDLFGAMDIFLLTSYKEGLPNVVMEAMAMELPCIVTDAGGSRELVEEGSTGHVVPLGRETEIPGLLRELIRDPERRRSMGRSGRKRIEDQFSVETMVEATVRLYSGLLHR
jgi:glycosyltransferase involved in cell wall biosynthesis